MRIPLIILAILAISSAIPLPQDWPYASVRRHRIYGGRGREIDLDDPSLYIYRYGTPSKSNFRSSLRDLTEEDEEDDDGEELLDSRQELIVGSQPLYGGPLGGRRISSGYLSPIEGGIKATPAPPRVIEPTKATPPPTFPPFPPRTPPTTKKPAKKKEEESEENSDESNEADDYEELDSEEQEDERRRGPPGQRGQGRPPYGYRPGQGQGQEGFNPHPVGGQAQHNFPPPPGYSDEPPPQGYRPQGGQGQGQGQYGSAPPGGQYGGPQGYQDQGSQEDEPIVSYQRPGSPQSGGPPQGQGQYGSGPPQGQYGGQGYHDQGPGGPPSDGAPPPQEKKGLWSTLFGRRRSSFRSEGPVESQRGTLNSKKFPEDVAQVPKVKTQPESLSSSSVEDENQSGVAPKPVVVPGSEEVKVKGEEDEKEVGNEVETPDVVVVEPGKVAKTKAKVAVAYIPGYVTNHGEVLVPVDTVIGDGPISILPDPYTPIAKGVRVDGDFEDFVQKRPHFNQIRPQSSKRVSPTFYEPEYYGGYDEFDYPDY